MGTKKPALREKGLVMMGARLPVALHREANHYRFDHDMTMRELLEAALTEYIRKQPSKK